MIPYLLFYFLLKAHKGRRENRGLHSSKTPENFEGVFDNKICQTQWHAPMELSKAILVEGIAANGILALMICLPETTWQTIFPEAVHSVPNNNRNVAMKVLEISITYSQSVDSSGWKFQVPKERKWHIFWSCTVTNVPEKLYERAIRQRMTQISGKPFTCKDDSPCGGMASMNSS
ncbi:hypothetical protein C8J55DRAFT_489216 [Lentinula edodes]|uniref:Uncharacterized protein n=1 Tax=Lentinula lateritia TaxID=40482 RepID=A0A9W9ADH0_9AGAR|nr:hypothetical protein C8J55DRAFT_489216 [Lentinula edodes]